MKNSNYTHFITVETMMSMDPKEVDFVYTGEEGDDVPQDVVRVRVNPSVPLIPAWAFCGRKKLVKVELCEGVVEIGARSFAHCSITKIVIPNSLWRISYSAFQYSLQCHICLHDSIESIGNATIAGCIFTNFRVPLCITMIPYSMLCNCISLFSVKIHKDVTEIVSGAFTECHCLQNVAFPPNADVDDDILWNDRSSPAA
jgi:hypothetical protein